jgi:hypothetical protein
LQTLQICSKATSEIFFNEISSGKVFNVFAINSALEMFFKLFAIKSALKIFQNFFNKIITGNFFQLFFNEISNEIFFEVDLQTRFTRFSVCTKKYAFFWGRGTNLP